MKPFYIHHHREVFKHEKANRRHLPKGFTALISPVGGVPNADRMVLFSATFCSNKDEYSKKAGREAVKDIIPELVNKRDVPRLLGECEQYVEHWPLSMESDYYYVLKYLV